MRESSSLFRRDRYSAHVYAHTQNPPTQLVSTTAAASHSRARTSTCTRRQPTFLFKENVMMLEADVVIGKINGSNLTDIPIMAHPPANESDLSLEDFLKNIKGNKGIKLDFKTNEAFNKSKDILKKMLRPVRIHINALII